MRDPYGDAVTEARGWLGDPSFTDSDRGHSLARWHATDEVSALEVTCSPRGFVDLAAYHGAEGTLRTWVLADPDAAEVALAFIQLVGIPAPTVPIVPPSQALHEAIGWLKAAGVVLPMVAS